jgi:hypothetical protein
VGLGASVSLAVAGIIAAGLGLLTMRSAFPPLPKPETPVVLARADRPLGGALVRPSAPAATAVVQPDELTEDAPLAAAAPARAMRPRAPALDPQGARFRARPSAPAPAAGTEAVGKAPAEASVDQGKLCKAPAPDDVASKLLQPGVILRYDTKYKSAPIDIPPRGPPPEEERRLKLSALLADMLDN